MCYTEVDRSCSRAMQICIGALQSVNSCAAVSIVPLSGPGAVPGRMLLRHLGHHMEIHTSVKNPSRSLFSTLHWRLNVGSNLACIFSSKTEHCDFGATRNFFPGPFVFLQNSCRLHHSCRLQYPLQLHQQSVLFWALRGCHQFGRYFLGAVAARPSLRGGGSTRQ